MNSDFSRILTLLRKERRISQKKAAAELGLSQALLSHYENGIRECGLDFVVRAADYYHVSCDYLLGRTPDPGTDKRETETLLTGRLPQQSLQHEPLMGAVRMLLTMGDRIGSERLSDEIERYLSAAVYRMFRRIYCVQPRNAPGFFTLPEPRAEMKARSRMEEAATEVEILAKDSCGERLLTVAERENAVLTTDILASDYGEDGAAMLQLVRREEEELKKR